MLRKERELIPLEKKPPKHPPTPQKKKKTPHQPKTTPPPSTPHKKKKKKKPKNQKKPSEDHRGNHAFFDRGRISLGRTHVIVLCVFDRKDNDENGREPLIKGAVRKVGPKKAQNSLENLGRNHYR